VICRDGVGFQLDSRISRPKRSAADSRASTFCQQLLLGDPDGTVAHRPIPALGR